MFLVCRFSGDGTRSEFYLMSFCQSHLVSVVFLLRVSDIVLKLGHRTRILFLSSKISVDLVFCSLTSNIQLTDIIFARCYVK